MDVKFFNRVLFVDICFHIFLITLIVAHPSYFKKELVGGDLVLHLLVLGLLYKVSVS
jgi:hypothetical protein